MVNIVSSKNGGSVSEPMEGSGSGSPERWRALALMISDGAEVREPANFEEFAPGPLDELLLEVCWEPELLLVPLGEPGIFFPPFAGPLGMLSEVDVFDYQ